MPRNIPGLGKNLSNQSVIEKNRIDWATPPAHIKMEVPSTGNGCTPDLSKCPAGPRYSIGKARIHLGADSPLIARHHINWRLQAMRALEKGERENLHYSSSVSISHEDFSKIREILVRAIESVKEVVRPSPEEKAACFAMDWFEI